MKYHVLLLLSLFALLFILDDSKPGEGGHVSKNEANLKMTCESGQLPLHHCTKKCLHRSSHSGEPAGADIVIDCNPYRFALTAQEGHTIFVYFPASLFYTTVSPQPYLSPDLIQDPDPPRQT